MPPRDDDLPSGPAAETDARFPSGRWKGFWLQRGMRGRQHMRLHLDFIGGRVTGGGSDIVGDFEITGTYDLKTGKCAFHKTYLGAHDVLYEGQNQNDGKWIWGLWQIRDFDRGGFHIWPFGEADPTGEHLDEQADLPVQQHERRRLLVPSLDE